MTGPFALPREDAGALRGAAGTLGRVSGDLASDRQHTTGAVAAALADWTGPRSAAFDRAAGGVQVQLRVAEDGCADVAAGLHDYARAVADAHDEIAELHRRWTTAQAALDAVGAATDPSGDRARPLRRQQDGLAEQAADVRRDLARRAASFARRIDAVTSRVAPASGSVTPAEVRRQVRAELAASLPARPTIVDALAALGGARRAIPAGAVLADGTVDWSLADDLPVLPDPGSQPLDVHLWWVSLSPTQQDALLRAHPRRLGNLDGIPVVDRDAANRRVLPVELARLRADLAALGDEPARIVMSASGYPVHNTAWDTWKAQHDDLAGRIRGTRAIRTELGSDASPPSYLIGFQPRLGNGRAIVAQGDPDTARDTSVFVTGTTTRLGGIGADLVRSRLMRVAALRRGADPAALATVTWYGYDAPQNIIPEAASLRWADAGAPILDRFAAGLRATHRGERPAHTTVVAHSYGSTLVGRAASGGHVLDVDDLVLVASPGVGVGHGWLVDDPTTVDSLHLSGPSRGHVFATRSQADAIKWATGTHLGVDPTRPGFGAVVFGSPPGAGHDDYWNDDDSPAVTAMGQVISGHGSLVAPPTPSEDVHPPVDVSVAVGI